MFSDALLHKAIDLLAACRARKLKIATAESCTGGLISALLTEIAGSSDVFERGFVTYSNAAKTELLGVDAALIAAHGAVSEEVAAALAIGALTHAKADLAVAVTGIAGPSGDTTQKPVGLVYIAAAKDKRVIVQEHHFTGNRSGIRLAAVAQALELLFLILESE